MPGPALTQCITITIERPPPPSLIADLAQIVELHPPPRPVKQSEGELVFDVG